MSFLYLLLVLFILIYMSKKYVYAFVALAMVMSLSGSQTVSAQDTTTSGGVSNTKMSSRMNRGEGMMRRGGGKGMGGSEGMKMKPAVIGTVASVNGNSFTVTSMTNPNSTVSNTTSTFTVDATNAKITKGDTAGTVSTIVVGDTVMVIGTTTGNNIVATLVRDGIVKMPKTPGKGQEQEMNGKAPNGSETSGQNAGMMGNGQPIVAGNVTSISGTSLVITNKSNVTYTVDASSAKINQGPSKTATISNISVGDTIVVQGAVTGTNVVASTIIDQPKPSTTNTQNPNEDKKGFFGGVGAFFSHMFGF